MSRDHPCCQTTINPATARSAAMARSRANSEGVARLCANRNSGRRYARYTLYFRVIGPSVYFRRQARANHRNAVCFYSASKVTPSATSCIFRTSSRPLLATFKKLQYLFSSPWLSVFFCTRNFLSRAICLPALVVDSLSSFGLPSLRFDDEPTDRRRQRGIAGN